MEMPQSGERIRGREKMREFQEAYPNPLTMRLRRVIVRKGLWVVEIISDCGGRTTGRHSSSSYATGRCSGIRGTTPSRLRHPNGERSGSSRWNPKFWAPPNFRE